MEIQVIEDVSPQTGLVETLPALDKKWCQDITFLSFYPPPSVTDQGWSKWVETLETIDYDLHILLKLPHNVFWSQALYDKSLNRLLDSYLQHAPRPHEKAWPLPTHIMEILRNVHRRIFMTFLRLSTFKEDKAHQMTPFMFGDLIYTHHIYTVPRLLDLCSIYGDSNTELLTKMITNVFDNQPHYWEDMEQTIGESVISALTKMTEKCVGKEGGASLRLNSTKSLDQTELVDHILYITDITHTLSSLLTVFPPVAHTIWKTGLVEKLIIFYESTIPGVQSQWKEYRHIITNAEYITMCLRQAKLNSARLVYTLLMNCFHGDRGVESDDGMGQLLSCLTLLASEKLFLKEFQKYYNLSECVQSLKESHPNLDDTQLQYILSAVPGQATPSVQQGSKSSKVKKDVPNVKEMVTYVKELLPHLEDKFIKECLQEFNYNKEVVIDRILEGNLPPHLQPQEELPTSPNDPEPLDPTYQEQDPYSILNERSGIYDYDEFDVFKRNDIDLSRVHIGKKFESAQDILSDRSHVQYMKEKGLDLVPPDYDEYDDEYNDTYDSHDVGAGDQDSTEDLFPVKRLNVKGQFTSRGQKYGLIIEGGSEEEDSGDEGKWIRVAAARGLEPVKPVEPVKILQRPKTPENVKHQKESEPRKGGGAKSKKKVELRLDDNKPTKTERKTLQRTEGKGDTAQTDRERAFKEKHKGSRANHNRRALADKKRRGW